MDPMTIAAIASIGGGVLGNMMSGGDSSEASANQRRALQAILELQAPSLKDQSLDLEQYLSQGELNPMLEGALQQEASGMANIQTDPRLKNAQLDALARMEKIGASGGMDDLAKAQMFEARNNASAEANAQNMAIQENMARRGMGGGGLELLQKMTSNQNANQRLASSDMNANAQAQARALDAIMNQGNLAGQMNTQDFNQKSQQAQAQDAINQFNIQNSQNVQARNVASKNNAQATNLQNRQNLSNQNVDLKNQQQQYNKELLQTQFGNKKDIAALKSGAYGQAADQATQRANATKAMWGGIGSGVGQMIAGKGK